MSLNTGCKYSTRSRYSPIGIDLGSSMIKMLQLSCRNGRIIIHQKLTMPAPAGALIEGRIPDVGILADTLAEAKKKVNWHGGSINISLDNRVCQLRLVTMPLLSDRDLCRAMELEAEKLFPHLNNKRRISYTLIVKDDQNNYRFRNYLLAIVPDDILAVYNILVKKAGLRLFSLEAAPLALIRALAADSILRQKRKRSLQVIIDVCREKSVLIIVHCNSYKYHRIMPFGFDHLLFKYKHANEPAYIPEYDRLCYKKPPSESMLLATADCFSREIAHSIEYGLAQADLLHKEVPFSVKICGGAPEITNLIDLLQRQFRLDLNLLNPLENLETGRGDQSGNANRCNALFTKAFGLAIKDWLYCN